MAFEKLHGTLVLFSRGSAREGAEVASSSGLWVDLARIEAVLSRLQLADHDESSVFITSMTNEHDHVSV